MTIAPTELKPCAPAVGGVRVKPLPTQQRLMELLRYDPETGRLFWRPRTEETFSTADPRGQAWSARAWNSRNAKTEAFTAADHRGYRHGKIDGVKYLAHRVIWKMQTGVDPDTIDHINGAQGDNQWINLRDCSGAENSRNYRKSPGLTSPYRGVHWVDRDQKWAARISDGRGGKHSLGNYSDELSAAQAYDRAARKMHGQFATLNFPDEVMP